MQIHEKNIFFRNFRKCKYKKIIFFRSRNFFKIISYGIIFLLKKSNYIKNKKLKKTEKIKTASERKTKYYIKLSAKRF